MLVLSRKVGQELVINGNIRITVSRISGSRVTLGISAPDEVRIVRGELAPLVRSFEEDEDGSQAEEPQAEEPHSQSSVGWIGDHQPDLHELSRQLH